MAPSILLTVFGLAMIAGLFVLNRQTAVDREVQWSLDEESMRRIRAEGKAVQEQLDALDAELEERRAFVAVRNALRDNAADSDPEPLDQGLARAMPPK